MSTGAQYVVAGYGVMLFGQGAAARPDPRPVEAL